MKNARMRKKKEEAPAEPKPIVYTVDENKLTHYRELEASLEEARKAECEPPFPDWVPAADKVNDYYDTLNPREKELV